MRSKARSFDSIGEKLSFSAFFNSRILFTGRRLQFNVEALRFPILNKLKERNNRSLSPWLKENGEKVKRFTAHQQNFCQTRRRNNLNKQFRLRSLTTKCGIFYILQSFFRGEVFNENSLSIFPSRFHNLLDKVFAFI